MQRLRDHLAGRTDDATFHRVYFGVHLFGWLSAALIFGVYTAFTYWALEHHGNRRPSSGWKWHEGYVEVEDKGNDWGIERIR